MPGRASRLCPQTETFWFLRVPVIHVTVGVIYSAQCEEKMGRGGSLSSCQERSIHRSKKSLLFYIQMAKPCTSVATVILVWEGWIFLFHVKVKMDFGELRSIWGIHSIQTAMKTVFLLNQEERKQYLPQTGPPSMAIWIFGSLRCLKILVRPLWAFCRESYWTRPHYSPLKRT